MSKSVTFGISHPFILSETPVSEARAAVIDVANALFDGHEEHNPEVTPAGESGLDGVPSISYNIPVLVDDDNPLPAYDLLPQLLAAAGEAARARGYFLLSCKPTCIDLLDHLEDGTITQDNYGRRRCIGWNATLVDSRRLEGVATELDGDGDPQFAYWWGNAFGEAVARAVRYHTVSDELREVLGQLRA